MQMLCWTGCEGWWTRLSFNTLTVGPAHLRRGLQRLQLPQRLHVQGYISFILDSFGNWDMRRAEVRSAQLRPLGTWLTGVCTGPPATAGGGKQHQELAIETPADLGRVVFSPQGKSPPEQAVMIIGPFAQEGAAELMRMPAAAEELLKPGRSIKQARRPSSFSSHTLCTPPSGRS